MMRLLCVGQSPPSSKKARVFSTISPICGSPWRSAPLSSQIFAIGRVRQLEAAIAAVDRDRLVKVSSVSRWTSISVLYRPLECQLVGDVLVDEGEAAERVGRHEVAQGALVGQMEQALIRLDERGEHGELLLLEGAESAYSGMRRRSRRRSRTSPRVGSVASHSSSSRHSVLKAVL